MKQLDFLYNEIGCDSIEIVRVSQKLKQVLIVDEESLCKESPELNVIASLLAGQPIYDTAILCEEAVIDGEHEITGFDLKGVTIARISLHGMLMESGLFKDSYFKEDD